eukprot:TRINITY_DN25087_c0_g1_i3.p1 TRINITY_DN25087_c0_g1~~TRINITY_DN25087_c0_g1_i3.p1  ORF type:complete len:201 (+),score=-6.65 TRINITY_DN25087_c0_g1_i3:169-771(+)
MNSVFVPTISVHDDKSSNCLILRILTIFKGKQSSNDTKSKTQCTLKKKSKFFENLSNFKATNLLSLHKLTIATIICTFRKKTTKFDLYKNDAYLDEINSAQEGTSSCQQFDLNKNHFNPTQSELVSFNNTSAVGCILSHLYLCVTKSCLYIKSLIFHFDCTPRAISTASNFAFLNSLQTKNCFVVNQSQKFTDYISGQQI